MIFQELTQRHVDLQFAWKRHQNGCFKTNLSELQENTERQLNEFKKTILAQNEKCNRKMEMIKNNQTEMLELKNITNEMKSAMLSHVQLFVTPWTLTYQASLSMEFSRKEYWRWLPFPSPREHNSRLEKSKRKKMKRWREAVGYYREKQWLHQWSSRRREGGRAKGSCRLCSQRACRIRSPLIMSTTIFASCLDCKTKASSFVSICVSPQPLQLIFHIVATANLL